MKLFEKMKRFYLMKQNNGGFTLVELIVVIAILAILAGVAIPAYSGYVEKAERTADDALVTEINTAFTAACVSNGESNYYRNDVVAGLNNGKFVYSDPFATEFNSFFEGQEKEFQVINNLVYDLEFGGFKDPSTAETLTLAYGNGYVLVTGEAINALLASSFYGEGMTSGDLMNQVNTAAIIAGGMGTIANVMNTPEFVDAALNAFGLVSTGDFAADAETMQNKAKELALQKMGLTDESQITESNKAQYGQILKDINNNALILYTAKSTTNMDAETAMNLLDGVNSDMIKKAMNGELNEVEKATGLNQAALAYGMYYAYINSEACTDNSIKGNTEIYAQDVINALDSNTEFKNYMDSDQGVKDMEAYLQALKVVESSTKSPEAVEKLVVEGFTDPDLLALLTQTMGK